MNLHGAFEGRFNCVIARGKEISLEHAWLGKNAPGICCRTWPIRQRHDIFSSTSATSGLLTFVFDVGASSILES